MRAVVLVLLVVFSTLAMSGESFVTLGGYTEYGIRKSVDPRRNGRDDGVNLNLTGAYVLDDNWTVISFGEYDIVNNETQQAFVGIGYDNVTYTYGEQPQIYDMFMDKDYTPGLGDPTLGAYLGGRITEGTHKLHYSNDGLELGVSVARDAHSYTDIISTGITYSAYEWSGTYTYLISMADELNGIIPEGDKVEAHSVSIGKHVGKADVGVVYEDATFIGVRSKAYMASARYQLYPRFAINGMVGVRDADRVARKTVTLGYEWYVMKGLMVTAEFMKHVDGRELDTASEITATYSW